MPERTLHAKCDGEDLLPMLEKREIGVVACLQPKRVEDYEPTRQPDREGKLQARQYLG